MQKAFSLFFLLVCPFIFGQVNHSSNLSTDYIRTGARNAATNTADAVVYNPSGLVDLGTGFHFSLDNQFAFKSIKHNANSISYENDANDLFLPNFYATYTINEKMAVGTGVYTLGGVGNLKYDKSLLGNSVEVNSRYTAIPIIFTYKFLKDYSVAVGLRYVHGHLKVEGSTITTEEPTANGITGLISLSASPVKNLLITGTFEGLTKLTFKDGDYERDRDLCPVIKFGASYKLNEKATLLFDYNYYFQVSSGWGDYEQFQSNGDILKGNLSDNAGDCMHFGLGGEYQLNNKVLVSGGLSYTKNIREDMDKYYSTSEGLALLSVKTDNISFGLGGQYKINKLVSANLGYRISIYPNKNINYPLSNGGVLDVKLENMKNVISLGLVVNLEKLSDYKSLFTIEK